eukprot:PhF_6_TR35416/c0_g1_i2/m.51550/K01205/NAGLU; alpha-N-acetylglucosaminidase
MFSISHLFFFTIIGVVLCNTQSPTPNRGNVSAAYDLLERLIPYSSSHFQLGFLPTPPPAACGGAKCFTAHDSEMDEIVILGTTASEITAGIGWYLKERCNMTIGWPRGGGSNVFYPNPPWPAVGATIANPIVKKRILPWSYIMNVCTHSYSLVWYGWNEWSAFIDWMALSGINLALAMTGQEEVQYKVFQKFGLDDETIRTWFNGPAFLTWSRGQNEYGNNIAGPLPRSFMQSQWALQRQILNRYRSLGIVSQLPGFQGNVPWKMSQTQSDHNMTQQGDTGWMYSTDPLFSRIADVWMETLIQDFGTDHWYQLDGYFNGGTAPWFYLNNGKNQKQTKGMVPKKTNPPCKWSGAVPGTYLAGCSEGCKTFATIAEAMQACTADETCGGITLPNGGGLPQLRAGSSPQPSPSGETSYYIINNDECHYNNPYKTWKERGAAAYMGLNRTDPNAIWSFQGWAIIDWSTKEQALSFQGFVDSVPKGKFVVIDMSVDGSGEWRNWNSASFFGAPFIWTTLHDFGGTDGIKGQLSHVNQLPFSGIAPIGNSTAWGTGYTPEGIDQNPIYYEFVAEQNFRTKPVSNLTQYAVDRAHRRYSLTTYNAYIANSWSLLLDSAYNQDLSVQDGTGIPHLPASFSEFGPDRVTPSSTLCKTFQAWQLLLQGASAVSKTSEPFRYDLVNLGREILAQISSPLSQNFNDAITANPISAAYLNQTGLAYYNLLMDADALVGTDRAFLLGPWITMARNLAGNATDCGAMSCPDFMEWNARCQITTWNPTPQNSAAIPDGPIDYASKHWNGLISEYYAERVKVLWQLGLQFAAKGQGMDGSAQAKALADLASAFQISTKPFPQVPQGDFVNVSQSMFNKYKSFFVSC